MNDPRREDMLRDMFRKAAESEMPSDNAGQHVVDDDELLIEWSLGGLNKATHAHILSHLAECSYCRRELAAMIRAGALTLPEHGNRNIGEVEPTEAPQPPATVRFDRSAAARKRNLLLTVAAIAASLMLAIIWGLSDRGGDSMVAMAHRDLEAGRHADAMDRIAKYLDENKGLAGEDRTDAEHILEESGYQLARNGLKDGSFQKVLDIEGQAARHSATSGRLVNLRIQAERGVPAEQTLAAKGTLKDYGYELDGQQYAKGLPTFDATTARLEKELGEAVQKHPDSLELRLNYGQFLIEQNDFEHATEQFTAAARLAPNSTLAQTGLGLALFQQGKDATIKQALGHFRKAVELSPDDPATNLNLAICLRRLGRESEAEPYFRNAQNLTPTASGAVEKPD